MSIRRGQGFTLIEVLLATAIFAVISLTSFSVLDGVIKTKEGVELKQAQLNEIQRAWLVIERDFLQIAWRSVRVDGEAPVTRYFNVSESGYDDGVEWLSFVRAGWSNPNLILPRSDLQAVAYRIEEENLQRLHFNFVDAVVGEEPKIRMLIQGVEQMQVQYFIDDKWHEQLPSGAWPSAIDFKLTISGIGDVNRKFLIPAKPVASAQPPQSGGNGNNGNNENDAKRELNSNPAGELP